MLVFLSAFFLAHAAYDLAPDHRRKSSRPRPDIYGWRTRRFRPTVGLLMIVVGLLAADYALTRAAFGPRAFRGSSLALSADTALILGLVAIGLRWPLTCRAWCVRIALIDAGVIVAILIHYRMR